MSTDNKAEDPQEATSPTWLNTELIQAALHRSGETNLQVTNVEARLAIPPGENYGSALYRVTATLADDEELSLIVKTLPPEGATAATIRETKIFEREIATLARAVPQMEALLQKATPGSKTSLAPRCLHSSESDHFIIMDDLATQGFKCGNRCEGLDLPHCLVALRALARFHASSAALLKLRPEIAQELQNPYNKPNEAFANLVLWGVKSVLEVFREMSDMEEVTSCLEKFVPVAVEKFSRVRDPKPGGLNVIIHADFWVNNMMFRYENGQPHDIRFVDFQFSQVASAALDVLYFLSTSPNEDVSIHHEELLIQEYHKALANAMRSLGLQAPPLEALHAELDANSAHVLFGATCALPAIRAVTKLSADDVWAGDGGLTSEIFRAPATKKWLRRVLPEYARKGWLPG